LQSDVTSTWPRSLCSVSHYSPLYSSSALWLYISYTHTHTHTHTQCLVKYKTLTILITELIFDLRFPHRRM
ncbi:Cyclin-A2, partial [Clarias magur]